MAETNPNARLEAFCDAVFAIALTLLIIDIRLPASVEIQTTDELWRAIGHLLPAILAFVLSFAIILITWANHHDALKLVNRSSHPFVYANGLLLLSVVFIPFPTALLGEYVLTGRAAPAVILYSGVCGLQAIGWNLMTRAALGRDPLTRDEHATRAMRRNHRYSYYALALYTACAIVAVWFPLTIAVAISAIWVVWLITGITMKDA